MRYSTFDTEAEARGFAADVQAACDANNAEACAALQCPEGSKIEIIPAWVEWMGKWIVSMPVEPEILKGNVVDSVEPPVSEEV